MVAARCRAWSFAELWVVGRKSTVGFPGAVIRGFPASRVSFSDLNSSRKVEKIRPARMLTT